LRLSPVAIGRAYTLDDGDGLRVSVAEQPEADDILVALHESPESVTPSVKAISIGGNVSDQDGTAVRGLKSSKFTLKPLDFIAWIVPILEEVPVLVIACLSIDTNDSCVVEEAAIFELQRSGVVAVGPKLSESLIVEPVCPVARECIDWNVGIG
jgi:hypothetical protein